LDLRADFSFYQDSQPSIGAIFGIWLSFNPVGLGAAAYVMQQQHGIRTLNGTMPILGALTILLTIAAAVLARNDVTRFTLLLGGTVCFVAVALITRFLNQPINAIMIAWSQIHRPPIGSTARRLVALARGALGGWDRRIVPLDYCHSEAHVFVRLIFVQIECSRANPTFGQDGSSLNVNVVH
jgi:hypothetical protein